MTINGGMKWRHTFSCITGSDLTEWVTYIVSIRVILKQIIFCEKNQVAGLVLLISTLNNTIGKVSGYFDKISFLSCMSQVLWEQKALSLFSLFILLHVCWHQMTRVYMVAQAVRTSAYSEYSNICTVQGSELMRLFEARGSKPRGSGCPEACLSLRRNWKIQYRQQL